MRKKILLIILVLLGPILSFGQGFKVVGTDLKDANGNNFIMKGINVPLAWFPGETNENLTAIKEVTGSNCIRLVVTTSTADEVWQTAVEKCIQNKMIPMVELHSVTGSNDTVKLHDMAEWWASKASFLARPDIARYILVNIANEWSDWFLASPNHNPSSLLWKEAYIRCINTMRNAGIKTTLVVDAPGYGQDNKVNVLLQYGAEVLNADPEKNILYSIHMYCEWAKNGNSNVEIHLPAVKDAGLPVIVGEFGFQHAADGSCDIDEQLIMNTCQTQGIGWLAWSWIGNGNSVEYLDMAQTWNGSSLTSWGETVVNGTNGTKTAVGASVFASSGNKYPTVSITAPAANSTLNSGESVTITASAADEDGTITKVDFYNSNILLFSDTEAPYTYTWSDVADGLYTLVATVYDNENGFGASAPVKFRVGEEPKVTNMITNNEFDNGTTGWEVQNNGGANGDISVVTNASMSGGNALKICASNGGTANWHVQVLTNTPFVAGKKYEISFMAKADAGRPFGFGIQQNGGSWTVHTSEDIQLTDFNQTFKFPFEPTVSDATAQLKFYAGFTDACIYVDNVVFGEVEEPITTSTSKALKRNIKVSVYPNPFEKSFNLTSGENNSDRIVLNLTDLNGKKVYETDAAGFNQEIVFPESIPAGMYVLIVTRGDDQAVLKVVKK